MLTARGKTEQEQRHAAKIQTKNRAQIKPESRKCRNKERYFVFELYNSNRKDNQENGWREN
jgi:hypothetical protein